MAWAMAWPCAGPKSRVRRISMSRVPCSSSTRLNSLWVDILAEPNAAWVECQGESYRTRKGQVMPTVNPIIRAVLMSRPVRYGLLILLCLAVLYRVPADLGQTRGASGTSVNKLMFHGGRERLGWNALETELTPETVAST